MNILLSNRLTFLNPYLGDIKIIIYFPYLKKFFKIDYYYIQVNMFLLKLNYFR